MLWALRSAELSHKIVAMKRALKYLLAVVLCFAVAWTIKVAIKGKTDTVPEGSYIIPRQVRYSFTVHNKTNRLVENVQVWAYTLVQQTNAKLCNHIEASHPYQLVQDSQGNPTPGVTFKKNPPYIQKNLKINTALPVFDRTKPSASCSYGKTPACGSAWYFITNYFGF